MIAYLRFLSGKERTREANRHLGLTLAFTAGAVNAGGFMAVGHYTSHVTGVLSSLADNAALGEWRLAAAGGALFAAFVAGGATSAVLINWARRRRLHSEFAFALLVEALLLLGFGLARANRFTVPLLCYVMGLQNAIVTKLSGAEIRTTHMTGNATDLGIELGKLLYWNFSAGPKVAADRSHLKVLAWLVGLFTLGGVLGGLGFARFGLAAALPISLLLFVIALVPIFDDLGAERRT